MEAVACASVSISTSSSSPPSTNMSPFFGSPLQRTLGIKSASLHFNGVALNKYINELHHVLRFSTTGSHIESSLSCGKGILGILWSLGTHKVPLRAKPGGNNVHIGTRQLNAEFVRAERRALNVRSGSNSHAWSSYVGSRVLRRSGVCCATTSTQDFVLNEVRNS